MKQLHVMPTALLYSKKAKSLPAFTLIELLIVIVIIGILASVLIAIVNPRDQQNRARDATTIATINKLALGTSSYISAFNQLPDDVQFTTSFDAIILTETLCADVGAASCQIQIIGAPLPITCDVNGYRYTGGATSQCNFYYFAQGDFNLRQYRLVAMSWGIPNRIYVYDSTLSRTFHCQANANPVTLNDNQLQTNCTPMP